MDNELFKINFLDALNDDSVAQKLQALLVGGTKSLQTSMDALTQSNKKLLDEVKSKDHTIKLLESRCSALEEKLDDLEQWGRRGSMRIQGLPEEGAGQIEDKIIALCNEDLGLQPPLEMADIEVAHRLPQPKKASHPSADATSQVDDPSRTQATGPRSVIVKFASRRVKSRVMSVRKKLKDIDSNDYALPIYFQDDLTARRAKLAYDMRQLKKRKVIADTWVWDSKILCKDLRGRIHNITRQKDTKDFE